MLSCLSGRGRSRSVGCSKTPSLCGGKTSENSLNEPAELSLRCLAKTENDHGAAPLRRWRQGCWCPCCRDRKPDDAIQRQGLVGLRPGWPREGPPCPTRAHPCSGNPPLPGVGRPRWRLPAGRVSPSRLTKATAPLHRPVFAFSSSVVA